MQLNPDMLYLPLSTSNAPLTYHDIFPGSDAFTPNLSSPTPAPIEDILMKDFPRSARHHFTSVPSDEQVLYWCAPSSKILDSVAFQACISSPLLLLPRFLLITSSPSTSLLHPFFFLIWCHSNWICPMAIFFWHGHCCQHRSWSCSSIESVCRRTRSENKGRFVRGCDP